MSFLEQVREWPVLIEVRGNGFSGRLSVFLRSGRAVALAARSVTGWERLAFGGNVTRADGEEDGRERDVRR